MTLYFGLNVNRNLTDISNNVEALANLKLDINDLNLIKGVTDPGGVTTDDFKGLSSLDFDYEKNVSALSNETSYYNMLTTNFYDESSYIDNNLTINGQLGGTSIKYLYVDYATKTIKTAEISTSRVSSWSSFASPQVDSSPIFYGGEVICQGPIEFSSLAINSGVKAKRFESEIPTHKIKTTIAGETVWLYAMKGIPLTFRGFFRTANLSATVQGIVSNGATLRPSWVIKNTANSLEYVYQNKLSGTISAISFSDTLSQERDIEFYYPADNITILSLPSIALIELPAVNLTNLTSLSIQSNDFREMPDLVGYTNLKTLDISSNNLGRSSTTALKTLVADVVNRLPTGLTSITMGNCYAGTNTADFSRFTQLTTLNLSTDQNFLRLTGTSPKVPSTTIQNYNITNNAYTSINTSVMTSTSLLNLAITQNGITQSNLSIASTLLQTFESNGNYHNVVSVTGKTALKSYNIYTPSINGSTTATNVWNGCSSLQTISCNYSPITGALPQFVGCTSLSSADFYATQLSGSGGGYALTDSTFNSCRSTLGFFRVSSPKLNGVFSSKCIGYMPALTFFWMDSQKSGPCITGGIPDFSLARNINYILLFNNNLTGTIPNFDANTALYYLHVYNNQLTGPVPNIKSSIFTYLILSYNQLSSFGKIASTSLYYADLAFNKIPSVPDLSNLKRLAYLYMNNQTPVGGRLSYTPGSFVGMTSIYQLNLANNNITQGNINQIIKDLSLNYDANPRGNVSVNLSGNNAPSSTGDTVKYLTKLRTAGWTIQTA
jgi:hypothetical protein